MTHDFTGRTVLVTGAARNIGRAIALAFADGGANVGIIVNSSRQEGEAVAAEARERGVKAAVAVGDIAMPQECERMVGEITAALGPIDTLVNNAAQRPREGFLEITPEKWNAVLGSNLSAVFYLARLVLPGMKERGFGRIINIGGPDGLHGMKLRAHNVACKAGLVGLTKAIALEFGPFGVTANLVIPGIMNTSRDAKDYPEIEKIIAELHERNERSEIAIPRPGEPEEMANAVTFLASEKSSYLTSQSIYVSGGLFGMP